MNPSPTCLTSVSMATKSRASLSMFRNHQCCSRLHHYSQKCGLTSVPAGTESDGKNFSMDGCDRDEPLRGGVGMEVKFAGMGGGWV